MVLVCPTDFFFIIHKWKKLQNKGVKKKVLVSNMLANWFNPEQISLQLIMYMEQYKCYSPLEKKTW